MTAGEVTAAPLVTVVVPFHDEADELPALVDALAAQRDMAGEGWELLLVDDGSTDGGGAVAQVAMEEHGLTGRVLRRRGGPGSSYAARNVGVEAARGRLVAFTDADCRPDAGWLAAIADHLTDPGRAHDVVAGAVDLVLVDATNPWELFDHAAHLDNEGASALGRVATANMAVARAAFREVGGFREVSSGGDHDWSTRARARGWRVVFDPAVRVSHPTRHTREDVVEKVVRTSRGQGELASAEVRTAARLAARAVLRPLLVHRHVRIAATPDASGGAGLRLRVFGVSVGLRLRQVPAFVAGYAAASRRRRGR